ncbi:hypothetical protein [Filimonas effusa]|uniref:Uncharacterized protein n=1 Tax=Filimonas effusa TaxID=2508721 RepID=A0A4Q1D955_9BACT|nr:hypothetical protein [Filimonas effusa]RXK85897.1 hypothetical protein ESB13_03550 [Filimonas effusa]
MELPFGINKGDKQWGTIDEIFQHQIPDSFMIKKLSHDNTATKDHREFFARYKLHSCSDDYSIYIIYITDDDEKFTGYFLFTRNKDGHYSKPLPFTVAAGAYDITSQIESTILSCTQIIRNKVDVSETAVDSIMKYSYYKETMLIDALAGVIKNVRVDSIGSKNSVDTFTARISW